VDLVIRKSKYYKMHPILNRVEMTDRGTCIRFKQGLIMNI